MMNILLTHTFIKQSNEGRDTFVNVINFHCGYKTQWVFNTETNTKSVCNNEQKKHPDLETVYSFIVC